MKSKLTDIFNDIYMLFVDLRLETVDYSLSKVNLAMKTNICEEFSNATEDFDFSMDCGREVTKEQLQTLYDNLISFGKEFKVKQCKTIAEKVKEAIDEFYTKSISFSTGNFSRNDLRRFRSRIWVRTLASLSGATVEKPKGSTTQVPPLYSQYGSLPMRFTPSTKH